MYKIGLVGGIGSGKSTVAKCFREHQFCILDADKIAHEVLCKPVVIEQIMTRWQGCSGTILAGVPQRKAIADLVFSDKEELKFLENITWPHIEKEMMDFIHHVNPLYFKGIVLDVPLLFEVGWEKHCNEIWYVDCDVETRSERYSARTGQTRHEAKQDLINREFNQISLDEKRRKSTVVIKNNIGISELSSLIEDLLKGLI